LALASFQPFQLAIEVFFFALEPFFLLGHGRPHLANLRFGFVAQPKRFIFRIQDNILLLGASGLELQASICFALADAILGIRRIDKNADARSSDHTDHKSEPGG
jgi:hypothetical protein